MYLKVGNSDFNKLKKKYTRVPEIGNPDFKQMTRKKKTDSAQNTNESIYTFFRQLIR